MSKVVVFYVQVLPLDLFLKRQNKLFPVPSCSVHSDTERHRSRLQKVSVVDFENKHILWNRKFEENEDILSSKGVDLMNWENWKEQNHLVLRIKIWLEWLAALFRIPQPSTSSQTRCLYQRKSLNSSRGIKNFPNCTGNPRLEIYNDSLHKVTAYFMQDHICIKNCGGFHSLHVPTAR